MNPEYYSEDGGVVCVERKPMTDRQLELAADAIDFATVTWDSSSQIEAGNRLPYADFYVWNGHFACAVLKDGSQIELLGERNEEPIDLEQVDYVLLPDGIRLSAGS